MDSGETKAAKNVFTQPFSTKVTLENLRLSMPSASPLQPHPSHPGNSAGLNQGPALQSGLTGLSAPYTPAKALEAQCSLGPPQKMLIWRPLLQAADPIKGVEGGVQPIWGSR